MAKNRVTGQTKKGRVNNKRILSENRRPEIMPKTRGFQPKQEGWNFCIIIIIMIIIIIIIFFQF